MFSRLGRRVVSLQRRKFSDTLYPDKAKKYAMPKFKGQGKITPEMEKGADGAMEYISAIGAFITCAAFMFLPFVGSEQTIDQWARLEAEKRLQMQADGEEVAYGVYYHEADYRKWADKSDEEDE